MDTTKNRRTVKTLTAAGALAFLLGACAADDDADVETPPPPVATESTATETGAAESDVWTSEDEAIYQSDYEQAQQHLVEHYGILDSADFCDSLAAGDTAVLADLAAKSGLTWDDDAHLADSGIADAAYEWCDN